MAQYYIGKNNERLGPFPVEQLIANGITPDTLVWCTGMPGWAKAKDVPEVAELSLRSSHRNRNMLHRLKTMGSHSIRLPSPNINNHSTSSHSMATSSHSMAISSRSMAICLLAPTTTSCGLSCALCCAACHWASWQ